MTCNQGNLPLEVIRPPRTLPWLNISLYHSPFHRSSASMSKDWIDSVSTRNIQVKLKAAWCSSLTLTLWLLPYSDSQISEIKFASTSQYTWCCCLSTKWHWIECWIQGAYNFSYYISLYCIVFHGILYKYYVWERPLFQQSDCFIWLICQKGLLLPHFGCLMSSGSSYY